MKALETLLLCVVLALVAIVAIGAMGNPSMMFAASQGQQIPTIVSQDVTQVGYTVTGRPSISAQFTDTILCTYHSPACGTGLGQALYSYGVEYGIDSVYALAFFFKESTFGTAGVARASLSIGNLRCIQSARCINNFAYFNSWQEGARAWFRLIRNLYVNEWKLTTPRAILARYAPSSDNNDPTGYAHTVEEAVTLWRAGKVALP